MLNLPAHDMGSKAAVLQQHAVNASFPSARVGLYYEADVMMCAVC